MKFFIAAVIIITISYQLFSSYKIKKANRETAKKMYDLMFFAYESHLKFKKEYSEARKMKNSPEKEDMLKNAKNGFSKCLSVLDNEKHLEYSKYLSRSDQKALEELLAKPRYLSVD